MKRKKKRKRKEKKRKEKEKNNAETRKCGKGNFIFQPGRERCDLSMCIINRIFIQNYTWKTRGSLHTYRYRCEHIRTDVHLHCVYYTPICT
jgi:hypothetical protein